MAITRTPTLLLAQISVDHTPVVDFVNERNADALIIDGLFAKNAYTAGSVFFGGTGGKIQEDNANLFWDNTNKRLGIGTNVPKSALSFGGSTGLITMDTSAGADTKQLDLCGGGANADFRGGIVQIFGNDHAATPGRVAIHAGTPGFVSIHTSSTTRLRIETNGNIGLWGSSYGSGERVLFIGNRVTAPTTNPVGGGILYCQGGALRYRGSNGTDVQLAAA